MNGPHSNERRQRWRWQLEGQVQGVGFRPFLYRLACRHDLTGFVGNDGEGVFAETQGSPEQLDRFVQDLRMELPPLAQLFACQHFPIPILPDEASFEIASSLHAGKLTATVAVDTAVCPDCLGELVSQDDRRAGYALINCTNCGPRYSIIRQVPYDRPSTTMAGFSLCEACQREYLDPSNRRFHAQPTACPDCGPKIECVTPNGQRHAGDPIESAVNVLRRGGVLGLKGLGGFHLVVAATNPAAVARLRLRKRRDAKPFALMCADIEEAGRYVSLSSSAVAALTSPQAPIVLLPRLPATDLAKAIAPGMHRLGLMLPYTPLHHLLLRRWNDSAQEGQPPGPLVMTSGNADGEPLEYQNAEALVRLGPLCDAILWHDRPIQRGIDDSVLLASECLGVIPLRRARGFVPLPIKLPLAAAAEHNQGLCVGGDLKSTVAVVQDGQVTVSQHLGDLGLAESYGRFRETVHDLCQLLGIQPRWIAADLHPTYLSSQYAEQLARNWQVPLLRIQHHHAHAAALLAESGRAGPWLTVACDGVGFGDDGGTWGGELLRVDLRGYQRLARLRPLWLPGGDAAARDTRRCGFAALHELLGDRVTDHPWAVRLIPDAQTRQLWSAMISRRWQCVASSAAGRWFDAVAALLGVCLQNRFEGEAGMLLEAAAAADNHDRGTDSTPASIRAPGIVACGWNRDFEYPSLMRLDPLPVLHRLLVRRDRGDSPASLAAGFHASLAAGWAEALRWAADLTGIRDVGLTGGVFANECLAADLVSRISGMGLRAWTHHLVPPGDGGLSLGQAAIVSAWLSDSEQDVLADEFGENGQDGKHGASWRQGHEGRTSQAISMESPPCA